ncbi:PTS fructose transporter subunit IIC [Pseudonocardia zijingensis]|uniref:PTS EIIC type-2 domain-containing protein n=1 Tax=Pseudonocardia zijingensis TaxID=153376 RepID=A0ABN1P6K8_9PSEU
MDSPTPTSLHGKVVQGVSHAIPFVVTGGVLLALGYALGDTPIGPSLHELGTLAFGLLVPVVGGYVAHAIGDRPALVPGFVGGAVAVQTGAGFLGGLVAGVLAGIVTERLARVPVPPAVAGLRPVLLLPLVATLVTGAAMWLVVGAPLAGLTASLTDELNGLSAGSLVLAGAALGVMVAADLGGPINKTAYTFAVGGLATGAPAAGTAMAAVMAAGMTPPLAVALATTVRRRLFTATERDNGRAAWLLGAVYVTEGAIPFAAADPLRVLPPLVAGSAVTGGLSAALGATTTAPHGGIFVLPMAGNPLGQLVAIAVGTLVSAAAVVALKSMPRRPAGFPVAETV